MTQLSDIEKGLKLLNIVTQFRNKHQISCPEAITQVDRIIIDGYDLISDLCDVVGYIEVKDE